MDLLKPCYGLNEVSKCQSVKLILNKTLKTYKTFFF